MEYLLGLDIGSTHLKAGLFTVDGRQFAVEKTGTKTHRLGEGEAIYEPVEIWKSVSALIRKLTASLAAGDRIISVAVASMGEAGLLLDANGRSLTPVISWFDSRGREMAEDWAATFGEARTFAITGLNIDYIYSLLKILWLKRHQPQVLAGAHKWLCMADFIYYKLSGEYCTDYSIASRTMVFDITNRAWSKEILEAAELESSLFPSAYRGGTQVGVVSETAAQETGLTPGTPVVTGGHDHICGAFAVGAFGPGKVLDSSGTAESVVAAFRELPTLKQELFKGFNVGCHVTDTYYLQGGINASGLSIEWFKDEFGKSEKLAAEASGVNAYEALMTEAAESSAGAKGIIFVPHLRGAAPPYRDRHSRAAFLGIRDYHRRGDFIRAVLEGLAFEFVLMLDEMEKILDLAVSEVLVTGGGTRNHLWMEIKAAASGRTIAVPAVEEATLLGAALLGGIGAGVYRDADEAVAATHKCSKAYRPDPELSHAYRLPLETYRRIIPLAREINQRIRQARIDLSPPQT